MDTTTAIVWGLPIATAHLHDRPSAIDTGKQDAILGGVVMTVLVALTAAAGHPLLAATFALVALGLTLLGRMERPTVRRTPTADPYCPEV